MKRLLVLTAVSLSASALGCKHCGLCGGGAPTAVYRPPCPTPACGAPTCGGTSGSYIEPGGTSTPVLTVPQSPVPGQTFPGPEAYTPATP